MRHEDATRLTFPDCAFDDIGTFDVLEHVPNYHRALAEFFRCLRPNGTLIITVPFSLWSAATVTRATIDTSGNITHLLPPETHDDPINQGGALAFYTFGWDLMGALTEVGFKDTGISIYWNPQLGYLGGYQYVGVKLIKRIFKVRSRFSQRLTANESIALNPSRHVFLPKLVGYSVDDQFSGMYCPDQL
jgi:SAM-dependent methyltransferase